ncbi:MAG: AAA family ATPase [Candidatus Marinimicrobia bacterium]|nr:AAA family ATPase [Candidatus Neomarinimicrobiota bacterium]
MLYKLFHIKNFRCFRDFKYSSLDRVNLITGMNNVGKTALLEAIWLHQGRNNPQLSLNINAKRGLNEFNSKEFLLDIFNDFNFDKEISIKSVDSDNFKRSTIIKSKESSFTELPLNENGDTDVTEDESTRNIQAMSNRVIFTYKNATDDTFQTQMNLFENIETGNRGIQFHGKKAENIPQGIFISSSASSNPQENAERFGELTRQKRKEEIIQLLKHLTPELRDLEIIPMGKTSIIHGDLNTDRLYPIQLLGDGLNRLLTYGLAITASKNGIVLIDEIENGLHYSVLPKIWSALAELARKSNVQLFATTHSEECIRAAYNSFSKSEKYDFKLHRIDKYDNEISQTTYEKDTLGPAIEQGFEVR